MQKQKGMEEETKQEQGGGLSKSRVEALADGIFAVAMTLLVFNVHWPDFSQKVVDPGAILYSLFIDKGQGAVLIAYVLSFAQLGVYWVSHHAQFQYIRRVDRNMLWINILFLLLVSFIPLTTQLLGAHWNDSTNPALSRTVLIIYGAHLMLIACVVALHWGYATRHHRLVDRDLGTRLIQVAARRTLASPVICAIAFAFAFINPFASMICYLFIPVYYILPGRIDWHWRIPRRYTGMLERRGSEHMAKEE
jgi:uncharacterized membrane protein